LQVAQLRNKYCAVVWRRSIIIDDHNFIFIIRSRLPNRDRYPKQYREKYGGSMIPWMSVIVRIARAVVIIILGVVSAAQADLITSIQTSGSSTHGDMASQKESVRPNPRFTNPDGTTPVTGSVVVDQLTGLMWLRDANCIKTNYASFDKDGRPGDGAVGWRHVLSFVAGINAGTYPNCGSGKTDWRIPTRKELTGLINDGFSKSVSWLNDPAQGFINAQADDYWSTDAYPYAALATARGIQMYDSGLNEDDMTYYYFYVWPVRSGK
jgi:hypothetical protein